MITRIAAAAMYVSRNRQPTVDGMAHVALLGSYEVTRRDADGAGAIVAAVTATDHIRVIDPAHRYPGGVAVAVLADIVGLDMSIALAGGGVAVVAACTVVGLVRMIEIGRYPGLGGMAIVTGIAASDVIRGLADRRCPIVATCAGALYVCMIDAGNGRPAGGAMTGIADLSRSYMARMLAGRRGPVVAVRAITCHTGMVIGGIQPGNRIVALMAGLPVDGDVCGRHTCCRGAVVATCTGIQHRCMVDPADSVPTECGVV